MSTAQDKPDGLTSDELEKLPAELRGFAAASVERPAATENPALAAAVEALRDHDRQKAALRPPIESDARAYVAPTQVYAGRDPTQEMATVRVKEADERRMVTVPSLEKQRLPRIEAPQATAVVVVDNAARSHAQTEEFSLAPPTATGFTTEPTIAKISKARARSGRRAVLVVVVALLGGGLVVALRGGDAPPSTPPHPVAAPPPAASLHADPTPEALTPPAAPTATASAAPLRAPLATSAAVAPAPSPSSAAPRAAPPPPPSKSAPPRVDVAAPSVTPPAPSHPTRAGLPYDEKK